MEKPHYKRIGNRVRQLSADEAIELVQTGATVAICGAGGGVVEPTALIQALAGRFENTQQPRDLTFFHSTGMGDRGDRGMSVLAKRGLVRRAVGGHWAQSPRLADMVQNNEIEGYNLPQGVMSQLLRAAAARQPGILTHVGLGTFIDPRQTGGKLNERTTEDLVQLMNINGLECLFYKTIPIDPINPVLVRYQRAPDPGRRCGLDSGRCTHMFFLSRALKCLRNLASFGATTNWQYPWPWLRVK